MRSFVFVCVLFGVCLVGESAKLPSSWGRCSKKDPGFDECIRINVELAVKSLRSPIPELGLSTPFEPLDIPELYIGAGKGPVNVAQHFKNVKLHGLTNAVVSKAVFDWDKKVLVTDSLNPELRLEGDYNMKGRILLLPVLGEGRCNITLINMKIRHHMYFDYVERKGKTYMKVVDFKVAMDPERVIFKFDNIFKGEEEVGNNINQVLNDNSVDVFNDVKEGYEKSFSLIFKDIANRILPKVPVKDIFLE